MYPIGIIGDLHIDVYVSSRRDNYFQTCLKKLEEVASKCKNVIILGDVFNRATIPDGFKYSLFSHLSYLKIQYGVQFYSIIGNHDIPNENEFSLPDTCLGLCEIIGLIKVIKPETPVEICGIKFYTSYVKLSHCKPHLRNLKLNPEDVLLLHQYFEDGYEGLELDDLIPIGCNRIFLGHNHTPLPNYCKEFKHLQVYRSGSLLRNSADKSNLTRDIYYFGLGNEVKLIKLNSALPANEVFYEKAYTQENLQKKHFTKSINNVLEKYTNNASKQIKFSIKETLLELDTPEKSMMYLENIYTRLGETFV